MFTPWLPKKDDAGANVVVRPQIFCKEGTSSVFPLTGDMTAPATYRVENVRPPVAGREPPCLIIDLDEEALRSPEEEDAPVRLVIDCVEATPSGYIVHHARQEPVTVRAAEPSPADNKSVSILAGCGVLAGILLLAVLVTIAPLVGGAGTAAGLPAGAAMGSSGAVFAYAPLVNTTQPVDGTGPAPDPGAVPATGMPMAVTSGDLPAETLPPQPVPPPSYVTLQPVPDPSSPPPRDISTALPVPVTDDYFTIYSLDGQKAQQNIPYVVFDLHNPPLVIDYTVSPVNITDEKELDYKIMATRHRENISISRPYEQSWFSVVVRDNETGSVVLEDGYGKTFSREPAGHLVVYRSGRYRVEFSGGFATVSLTMKVKKEGNIP